jgi:hypothetical protein
MKNKKMMPMIGWIVMVVLVAVLSVYSIAYFIPGMPFSFRPEVYPQSPLTVFLLAHIGGAVVAALSGPLQFWGSFRQNNVKTHRVLGKFYLLGVLVAGLSALIISPISQGGLVTHIGFALLAVTWLVATFMAYKRVLGKDWLAHQRWMIRSYSLTLAFVSLRIWLGGLVLTGAPFEEVYQTVAWICWVPNLIIAECYINRDNSLIARSPSLT